MVWEKILEFLKDYWWTLIVLLIVIRILIRIITKIKNKNLDLQPREKSPFPPLKSIFKSFFKSLFYSLLYVVFAIMIYGGVYSLLLKEGEDSFNNIVHAIYIGIIIGVLGIIYFGKSDKYKELAKDYGRSSLIYYLVYEFIYFNVVLFFGVLFFSKEAKEFIGNYIPTLGEMSPFFVYLIFQTTLVMFLSNLSYVFEMMKVSCFRCWTANMWGTVRVLSEGDYEVPIYETSGGKFEVVGTETITTTTVDECGTEYSRSVETRDIHEWVPRKKTQVGSTTHHYKHVDECCEHCGKRRKIFK